MGLVLGKCQRQPRVWDGKGQQKFPELLRGYLSSGVITQPLKEAARGSWKAKGFSGEGSISLP